MFRIIALICMLSGIEHNVSELQQICPVVDLEHKGTDYTIKNKNLHHIYCKEERAAYDFSLSNWRETYTIWGEGGLVL